MTQVQRIRRDAQRLLIDLLKTAHARGLPLLLGTHVLPLVRVCHAESDHAVYVRADKLFDDDVLVD